MRTKVLNAQQYKYMFFLLLAASVLSLAVYVYAVNQTVRNIVARQNMETELMELTALIGEKEFKYISQKNEIDLDTALSMGFRPVETRIFVSRQSSVALANGQSGQ